MKRIVVAPAITLAPDHYCPVVVGNDPISKVAFRCSSDFRLSNIYDDPTTEDYMRVENLGQGFSACDLDGGRLYESLGAELVTNGTFTGDLTGWTVSDTEWSYYSNSVRKDADGTGTVSQSLSIEAGALYKFQLTVRNRTAGNVVMRLGNAICGPSSYTEDGEKMTGYVVAANTDGVLFTPHNAGRLDIDDVSIKKVIVPATLFAQLNASSGTARLEIAYTRETTQ